MFFAVIPILFVLDYIITYIGVSRNIITEANPFMLWHLELPFLAGTAVRIAICVVLTFILWRGRKTTAFKIGSGIVAAVNFTVLLFHIAWILLFAATQA